MESKALLPEEKDAHAWLPNPFYKPLQNIDSLIRRALLTRMFEHALYSEPQAQTNNADQSESWFDASHFNATVAKVLLQVSREFEVRLSQLDMLGADNEIFV